MKISAIVEIVWGTLEYVQEYEFSRLPATYLQRQQQKIQK